MICAAVFCHQIFGGRIDEVRCGRARTQHSYEAAFGTEREGKRIQDNPHTTTNIGHHGHEMPVLPYCADDGEFEVYMQLDYENCELRSFIASFPHEV